MHYQLNSKILTILLLLIYTPICAEAQKSLSVVVLDAGHGGKDPGAIGKKCKEKDIVLDVTLRLGKMLKDSFPDVKSIYTRDKDVFIPLNERAEIANKNNADLFISIHANWVKNTSIQGTETFVLGLHRTKENLEVAQKENSVIVMEDDYTNTYEGFDPSQPESYIIFSLMQNTYLEQSILVASKIQESFTNNLHRNDRGVKQAGFLVLRKTSMPSILIELGFLSNAEEEAYMMSDQGKEELVMSIYNAFKNYKLQFDQSTKAAIKTLPKEEEKKPIVVEDGIRYKIQIISSSQPLEKLPTDLGEIQQIEEDGKYKYMVGSYSKYSEVSDKQKVVKKQYPDCFIVAYENGKKVTTKYARKVERR